MIQTRWLWLPERLPLPVPRTEKVAAHEALADLNATEQDSKPLRPIQRRYAAAMRALDSCQGVRIRGPSAVTAIVNSKWAVTEPSWE
jgi:hypothetical protein